jgi:hypothetical protein
MKRRRRRRRRTSWKIVWALKDLPIAQIMTLCLVAKDVS